MAFQALGRIYVQNATNGTPQRLTPASFTPLEYAPAWSPDGQWVAFVSIDDGNRMQLWKVSAAGGAPVKLSSEAADFVDPVWSPDGRSVVVARGEGATARGRTVTHNAWFDLVRYSAAGNDTGAVITTVTRPTGQSVGGEARRQLLRPSFGPEGRLFWPDERAGANGRGGGTALVSVKPDGSDRQVHVTFPAADEMVPSPDGQWLAFQEGDNVFLTPLAWGGIGGMPQDVQKRRGAFPVTQLSRDGGIFPRWRNARTLEWGSGNRFFVHHLESKKTDTLTLTVSAPRATPQGTVALTNARIVTLDHRKVIVAVVAHPRTPRHVSLPSARHLYTFELMQIALLPTLAADLKINIEETLVSRLETISEGERLTLAKRGSARVAAALLAGAVVVGVETLMARAELNRSRRQLAELDDRLLRDIGIDRAKAHFEADRGFWG